MTTIGFDDMRGKGLSTSPWLAGSVYMEGYGSRGAKPRPFNYELAVRQFHHWAYAASMLNANAAAGVPLRMYVRRRGNSGSGREVLKNFATRPVGKRALRYLAGGGVIGRRGAGSEIKPSAAVMAKVAAFGGDVEEVIESHPCMAALARPNPDDNGHEVQVQKFIDLQLTGNHYQYLIDSALGIPSQSRRMPPQWTMIKPNVSGQGDRRIAGYVYGKNTAVEQAFSEDEVIHWKLTNPKELLYGMGYVEATWLALGLHNAKRTEDLALKDNMSRPDWFMSVDGANPASLERTEAKLKEKHQGPGKSGRFLLAGGKATLTALNWEVKELGTPTRLIEEIAAGFFVPVAILLSNDPTKAGSVVAKLAWYRNGIHPLCLLDEEKLNQCHVSRFEGSEDYFVAYDHVSFEDEAEVTRRVVALVSGGIMSPNEARQEVGYGEAEGADYLYPPAGNTGGSAAAMGNLSPQQGDERPDAVMPGGRRTARESRAKGITRMPPAPGPGEGSLGDGLNGAQIEAAVEVFDRLRRGTLTATAAVALLEAVGIDHEKAAAAVSASPQDAGTSDADRAFLREVVLTFLRDGTIADVGANLTNMRKLWQAVGVPPEEGYEEPFLPPQDEQGRIITEDGKLELGPMPKAEPAKAEAVDLSQD